MPLNDPVPSSAPDVLLRNAPDFDKLINLSGYHTNRVGNSLPSYITAIQELGFNAPVAFAAGIIADSSRVTVTNGGNRYFARPDAVPFTTTSTFNPAQWSLFDQSFAGAEVAQIGTYSLLRAYAGAATLVYVAGRSNIFDGAYGNFAIDAADTTSPDNDGTILVDALGRRWKRQTSVIKSTFFGQTDTGIAAAFVAAAGKTLVFSKSITLSASFTVPAGTLIVIDSGVELTHTTSGILFSNASNAFVNGWSLTGGKIICTGGGGAFEKQKTDGGLVDSITISGTGASRLAGTKNHFMQAVNFVGGHTCINYAKAGLTAGSVADWGLSNKAVGCSVIGAVQGWQTLYQQDASYIGCTGSGSTGTFGCGFVCEYENIGTSYVGCYGFGNVRAGFYVEGNVAHGVKATTFTGCHGYKNGEAGITLDANFDGVTISGGSYYENTGTFAAGTGFGIRASGNLNVTITGAEIRNNAFHGINYLANPFKFTVSGNRIVDNGGRSINLGGSPVTVTIVGNSEIGNATGETYGFTYVGGNTYDKSPFIEYTAAWSSSGVQPAIGNGSIQAFYSKAGKRVSVQLMLTAGSTTSFGTGSWLFTLPEAPNNNNAAGAAFILDSSFGAFTGTAVIDGLGKLQVAPNNSASYVGATVPMAWAANDVLKITIEYAT